MSLSDESFIQCQNRTPLSPFQLNNPSTSSMSTSPAPVPFLHNEAITKDILDNVGSKSSYIKTSNGTVALVMLPAGDIVAVPSVYEKPLRVLAYRFELQKYTIPKVLESKHACKALLQHLLYLDRVRDRFIHEVRVVPDSALQRWRCPVFEYHLWLDYMYGRHDDEARKLLESQHGITLMTIASRKSGSNILKKCECHGSVYQVHSEVETAVDWVIYKQRYCKNVDLCGFEYPLDPSTIGKEQPPAANTWAKLILAGASSGDGGVVVHRDMRADTRELDTTEQERRREDEDEDKGRRKGKGKRKLTVPMETETEEEVHRERNIGQSAKGTCVSLQCDVRSPWHSVVNIISRAPWKLRWRICKVYFQRVFR